ncbi:hypothetical protein LTR53_009467 [Teratosphaeriaceae sp. CCFEE 6253]|nr:hypothetical protein LTR53_009467 [Teratosphaeriaceae sp. CCFEE 6253]
MASCHHLRDLRGDDHARDEVMQAWQRYMYPIQTSWPAPRIYAPYSLLNSSTPAPTAGDHAVLADCVPPHLQRVVRPLAASARRAAHGVWPTCLMPRLTVVEDTQSPWPVCHCAHCYHEVLWKSLVVPRDCEQGSARGASRRCGRLRDPAPPPQALLASLCYLHKGHSSCNVTSPGLSRPSSNFHSLARPISAANGDLETAAATVPTPSDGQQLIPPRDTRSLARTTRSASMATKRTLPRLAPSLVLLITAAALPIESQAMEVVSYRTEGAYAAAWSVFMASEWQSSHAEQGGVATDDAFGPALWVTDQVAIASASEAGLTTDRKEARCRGLTRIVDGSSQAVAAPGSVHEHFALTSARKLDGDMALKAHDAHAPFTRAWLAFMEQEGLSATVKDRAGGGDGLSVPSNRNARGRRDGEA